MSMDAMVLLTEYKKLESENATLKKMIGEWAKEINNCCPLVKSGLAHPHSLPNDNFCQHDVHIISAKMREAAK